MQENTVDIVMATYNSNMQFLKIQIDSLLNQTYKNIKIIISDDASTKTDHIELIKEYMKKDDRIELYINEKNVGYVKNFEKALNKSKSDYIMYCDHDDIWYKDKVEKSLKKLIEKNVDLVYCNANQIDENGKIINQSYIDYKKMPKYEGKNYILPFSRHIAIGCSQIFTKEIKEKMLPFKKSVVAHDWITVYLAALNKGVAYIDEPLFGYRLHNSNEFGGRNLSQNLNRWKSKYGNNYSSYKRYRNWAISETFYGGAKMCDEYEEKKENKKILEYYQRIMKVKIINFNICGYFKYLRFKGIGMRAVKEIVLFHFPVIGFMKFKLN